MRSAELASDRVRQSGVIAVHVQDEHLNTATGTPTLEVDKELKVRIPIEQHLMLHSLKVLTGKPISEAVAEALSAYFAGTVHERAAPFNAAAVEDVLHRVD